MRPRRETLLGLALACAAPAGCSVFDKLHPLPGRVFACDEIVVGMTEKEVTDKLGPAVEITTHERGHGSVRVLEYLAPTRGSNRAEIGIGVHTGQVATVDCKDGFRVE